MVTEEQLRQLSKAIDDLFASGKNDEGIELLNTAIDKAKENKAYRLFFEGEMAHYSGDSKAAYEKHGQAVALQPEDYFLLRNYGIITSILDQEEEAIELYDQALKIKPDDYRSLRNKGATLSTLDREEEAIELYDQALKIKPDDYDSLCNKGVSLSRLDRMEEAIELFDQALKIKPDDYRSLCQKGVSLSKLDRMEEAIELYDQALKIKPDDYHSLCQKGATLSTLDREEEAIELYDQALKIKPDDYDSLRNKGVSLSKLDRMEEAIELYDQALKIKPDDYHSLCQKGATLSTLDREEEAIELYDQALKIKPDDYDSLRNKGVSLSKLDRMEEAIELYDQALKIKPDDYHSLCQKGVSLSKLDRMEEAIELYDQALKIKPDDYHSLCQKGVTLSKLDQEEEAVELYDQALKIKPDDYDSLRNKGISLFKCGQISEAYDFIHQALEINPTSEMLQKDASFVFSQLSDEEQQKHTAQTVKLDSTNVGGLKGFMQIVRDEFKDEIAELERKKTENEQHLLEFVSADSELSAGCSVFLVLRKWNSYTPALPLDDGEKSVGGGYFIYHNGKGTVIDPGYNFIENFQKAGCRLVDIDNIVITHAHNDHTIDFESLLTLLYQSHKEKKQTAKKVDLYLNQGALLKFASLIDWRVRRHIGRVCTINAGDKYILGDKSTVMTVLPAYHDELVTRYYAVGLHFSLNVGEADKRSLLLTSDTGLYPPDEKTTMSDHQDMSSKTEIHELYKQISAELVSDIDIIVPHLGSIGKKELSAVEDMNWQPKDILYGNHLGVLGVLRIISAIKPKLALVSEFGEELKGFRGDLIKLMRKVVHKVMPDNPINILPADLPFIYDIRERSIFCVDKSEMIPAADTKFEEEDNTFYYYCDEETRKKFDSLKAQFDNTTQRPYLKNIEQ